MLFSRNFIAVALLNFLVMTIYYLLFVITTPYAVETFDATPGVAGLAAGSILWGCLAGRFVTGRLLAIVGFKKVLFTGLVIYTASLASYLAVCNVPLLIGARFCSGIGVGCVGTVTGTLVACIAPSVQHGRGISYFSLSTITALGLGPFLGIFLLGHISFTQLFFLCLCLSLAGFGIAATLSLPETASSGVARRNTENCSPFCLSDYIEYRVVPVALVTLCICICYGSVQVFLVDYAKRTGLVNTASAFFFLYAATAFCSRPLTGRLFDARGPNSVLYPAIFITACGLALLSRMETALDMLLAGVLLGIGIGNYQTAAQALSVRLVTRDRFGQATSTHYIFLDLGIGIGPYALGSLVSTIGYRGLYLIAACLAFLCLPLYHILHGREQIAG
jgi:MFS family permease